MGTYDHKQVIVDYATGKITPEMTIGHSLQHIDKLYEAQTAANVSWYELRSKVDSLENKVHAAASGGWPPDGFDGEVSAQA